MLGHSLNSACPGPGTSALQREGNLKSIFKKSKEEDETLVKAFDSTESHTQKQSSGQGTVCSVTDTVKLSVYQPFILPHGAARLSYS